jgi:putative acetyltransferase
MGKTEIDIGPEDPTQADVRRMLAVSDAYLRALYPPESNHLVDVTRGTGRGVSRRPS